MKTPVVLAILGIACLLVSCRSNPPEGKHAAESPAEAQCALCEKPIPAGTEVVLVTAAGESTPYRCIHCALTAQAATPPPSTVRTHSPLSATEITIRRGEDVWTVSPATAVFLSLAEEGGECMDRHRAFPDRGEFERYLDTHPEFPRASAVPYTIDRLAELLASGLPSGGIRPDAPVQLLVVGMVTHLPFKEHVLPAIEGALADAGDRIGARFVDATRPEGKAILAAHGIHEHLPVVMFLNGSSRASVQGRDIDLRGFPGTNWSREDLAILLRQEASRE